MCREGVQNQKFKTTRAVLYVTVHVLYCTCTVLYCKPLSQGRARPTSHLNLYRTFPAPLVFLNRVVHAPGRSGDRCTPPRFPHRGVGPAPAPDLLGKAALGHSGRAHCRRAARRARQVRPPGPHSLRSSHRLHGHDRQRPLVVAPRPPLTRGLPAINPVHRLV